jgi:putative membrane protein
MKQNKWLTVAAVGLIATVLSMYACKNRNKDSVEKADSANKTHIDSPAVNTPPVMTDEESSSFLVKAANEGMTEAQLGEMAREKGMNQTIRNFGAMITREHTAMIADIKDLASKRNVTLPEAISADNHKRIDELSARPRKEFDKAYIDVVIKDHESAVDQFSKAGDKVNDTDVKNFINNSLAKLKNHLDSARTVRKTLE